MGSSINMKKTETMSIGTCADFNIDGKMLAKVDRFKARIHAASCAVGRLKNRKFDCWDLTTETKLKVYNQCVIPLLMYGSETWTLHRKQVRQLRTIQQRHLLFILKIKWDDFVTNDEVLCLAKADDI